MRFLVLVLFFLTILYSQTKSDTVVNNFINYQKNIDAINLIQSGYTFGKEEAEKQHQGTRALVNGPELFNAVVSSVVFVVTDEGIGAGSIVDRDGHIITNYHVIEGAAESDIRCVIYNESFENNVENITREDLLEIKVVGTDKSKDLALLKLKKSIRGLKPIPMGQAYSIRVAQDVFAIGHPGFYLWYYTNGTVNRISKYTWHYEKDFIVTANAIFTQTPINTGNSGGPLLDEKGRMIGVNSATDPDMQNINIAIRIDDVQSFIKVAKSGRLSTSTGHKDKSEGSDEIEWEPFDNDNNGVSDAYVGEVIMDDGTVFLLMRIDQNEDGIIEVVLVDSNSDGETDIMMEDKRGDGSFSYWSIDEDFDGIIDWEGYRDT